MINIYEIMKMVLDKNSKILVIYMAIFMSLRISNNYNSSFLSYLSFIKGILVYYIIVR